MSQGIAIDKMAEEISDLTDRLEAAIEINKKLEVEAKRASREGPT